MIDASTRHCARAAASTVSRWPRDDRTGPRRAALGASPRPCVGDGSGTTPPNKPTASSSPTPSSIRRHPPNSTPSSTTSATVDRLFHAFVLLAATTGARRAQLLGLRWRNVHRDTSRVAFTAGWVEGPDGPMLDPTKTKRRHTVDLDTDRCHTRRIRRRDEADATGSCSATTAGVPAWKPNRVTKTFTRHRRTLGCARSDSTISVTSWPPRCSTPAPSSSRSCDANETTPPNATRHHRARLFDDLLDGIDNQPPDMLQ